ncbi:radical SAM protein [Bacteriovoracaceae bacterium]|nr:radical SAM protein [Bacteriovoracaceae bacterium]
MRAVLFYMARRIYSQYQKMVGWFNLLAPDYFKIYPAVFRIRITNKCNLHCDFCFLKEGLNVGEDNHLSLEEWDKLIKKIPKRTVVDITGAEPFLAKNFSYVLENMLDKGLKISTITNGLLVKDEIIEMMVKKKLYYLMISVDGLEESHNKLRGSDKSFRNIIKFIERMNEYKKKNKSLLPNIVVKSTLLGNNSEDLKELYDILFKLGVSKISYNFLFQNEDRGGLLLKKQPENLSMKGNLQTYNNEEKKEVKDFVEWALRKSRNDGRIIDFLPPMKKERYEEYIESPSKLGVKHCLRPYSVVSMYYDGTLAPCDLSLDVGNIREVNFNVQKVWSLKKFKNFIKFFNKKRNYFPGCDACCLAEQKTK